MRSCSRGLSLALLVAVLMLPACAMPIPFSGGPSTPSAAAMQSHSQSGTGSAYKVTATRTWGNRAIVFGVDNMPLTPGGQTSGQVSCYDTLSNPGTGWDPNSSGCGDSPLPVKAPSLVCGSIETGYDSLGPYTIVGGFVRNPDVEHIEISFSSGQTLSNASPDGVFAVIRPAIDSPTGMRLIDANSKEIYATTLSSTAAGMMPPPPPQSGSNTTFATFTSASETIDCQP